MYGFGRRSYHHLQDSVNHARNTELHALIYALGIPNIGLSNAKMICRAFDYDIEKVIHATKEDLIIIEGIGEVIADAYIDYFHNEKNQKNLNELLKELKIAEPEKIDTDSQIAGKVFVITGSVEHFANRNELKALIESKGGKVTGSVTSKTDYLINNDVTSNSSKNKKARELEIPILSEEDFLKLATD